MKKLVLSLLFALTVLCATSSHAQTSIFQGWSSKFPYYVTAPGSYKLTSNIVAPAGDNAIIVDGPGVTIDLNGYSIQGPISCTSSSCNSSDLTYGIYFNAATNNTGIVKNGFISGFGVGVGGNYGLTVEYLNVSSCQVGINVYSGVIDHNVVTNCQYDGIYASLATVTNNSVYNNAAGIYLYEGFVGENTAYNNTEFDIAGTYVSIKNNACTSGPC